MNLTLLNLTGPDHPTDSQRIVKKAIFEGTIQAWRNRINNENISIKPKYTAMHSAVHTHRCHHLVYTMNGSSVSNLNVNVLKLKDVLLNVTTEIL